MTIENVIKSGITINVDVSVQNIIYAKKNYVWNPTTCSCKNSKYLANIFDNSVITSKKQKQLQQIVMKKMQSAKQKISIFNLYFY